mgnify:CR=1 FL=1
MLSRIPTAMIGIMTAVIGKDVSAPFRSGMEKNACNINNPNQKVGVSHKVKQGNNISSLHKCSSFSLMIPRECITLNIMTAFI